MTEHDRKTAEKIKDMFLSHAENHIRRIILYGSRARGSALSNSDYDFLIVESDPVSKHQEMKRLRKIIPHDGYAVDIWVMGEQEFEETRSVIGGLAYPADKYGIVLYENA